MEVSKNRVVTIDYTVTNSHGAVVDSSQERSPLAYVHGAGKVIPGLEAALEGHRDGETVHATVPPEQAYGRRDERLRQPVPRERFETQGRDIEVGMQFRTAGSEGAQVVTVVAVDEDEVTIDANHPLAGETLRFDVMIVDVRDATAQELDEGAVHEPPGRYH